MSQKFKIIRDYYDRDEKIYDKTSVEFKPGLTVLVGCNGSGKTTLLRQIKEVCKKNKLPVMEFDNYHDGGSSAISYAGFVGDYSKVAKDLCSSEGERISGNMAMVAGRIGRFVRDNSDAEKLFILLDAIDSGLSVDNVIELKRDLFSFVIADCTDKGIEIYLIVSANEYELARGEQCFDVSSCKYVKINSYDEYRDVIIETRKKKNKRYGWGSLKYERML